MGSFSQAKSSAVLEFTGMADCFSRTLTTSVDVGAAFTGGSADDSFYASHIDNNATGSTLNPGDNLNGGAGNDTLYLTLTGSAANPSLNLQTSNIETLSIGNYNSNAGNDTVNLAATSGFTGFSLSGSGATAVTGVQSVSSISLSNLTGDATVTYASGKLSGTNSQTVTLADVGTSTTAVVLKVTDAGSTSNIAETLAITSNGTANYLKLDTANDHTTVTVGGAGTLVLDANADTTITSFNASAATGAVSLINIGATDLTVTGGAGNDTLRIDGSTITTDDSIDGGAGSDSLQFTVASNVTAATAGAKLVGFETVEGYANANDASLVVAQDLSLLGATVTNVGVSSWTRGSATNGGTDYTATDGVNFTNLAAGTNMSIAGVTVTDLDTNDGTVVNFTATADLKADTTADSIAVTLGTSADKMASVTAIDSSTAFNLTLALDDYETVTLNSLGGTNTVASITSGDLTKLVVNASKALTISAGTWAALATVDASASTANVTIAATTKASTITGGAGNDGLTGSAYADSIVGGAGNDTITAAAGNDILIGGDGDDTFNDAAADLDSSSTETASVSGGAGSDTFIIADFSDLSSRTTIDGGDGTDKLSFTETVNHDFTASATLFSNVSNVETLSFDGLSGYTVTLNDGTISNSSVNIELGTGASGTNTFDMDAVFSSSSTINFTEKTTGVATTYILSNAKDNAVMVDGNDNFVVTGNTYLSANDTINGGDGADTITFSDSTATSTTVTAITALRNIETFTVDTTTAAANFTFTLNDTILSNNVSVGSTLTVGQDDTDIGGKLKVDGSLVTSSYKLSLNDGMAADTLIGGAGQDTLTIADDDVADTLTGGAGNDTFDVSGLTLSESAIEFTITDFDFGTSTTKGDVLTLEANTAGTTANEYSTSTTIKYGSGATYDAGAGHYIVILDSSAYSTAATAEDALQLLDGDTTDDSGTAYVFWQDTIGRVHLSYVSDTDTDSIKDLGTFSNLTITGVKDTLNLGSTASDISFV